MILVPGSLEMSATYWHLPSTATGIKPCAAAAADLQHPPKTVQGGEQDSALWKTDRTCLQVDIFRSQFYESNSGISSYLEKH